MNTSLWQARQEIKPRNTINANKSFDIAIVGGGFSGLWSAYHLKKLQPSLSIAIFEKEYVGFGASGRNGGWASAEYPTSSKRLIREHGEESYKALRQELISSIDEIGAISAENKWDIDFAKGGSFVFAKNKGQLQRISKEIDSEHRYLNKDQTQELIGLPSALGAVFTPHCACLNPFKLTRALFEYLLNSGVEIFEKTEVSNIDSGKIIANGFEVACTYSIRATEAFTPRKWMGNKQIPIYSLMIASQVLPIEVISQIRNAQRATFQEACHLITYAQITADNRIALGGRGVRYKLFSRLSERSELDNRMHSALEKRAKSWFPQIRDFDFEYRWGGAVALTRRWQSYLDFDLRTGQAAIGGYVGDGVTLSYLVSKTLAKKICGQETANLPFIDQKIGKWEPEPFRYIAVNAGFKASMAADFEEKLTGRPSFIASVIDPLINR
jgi:glycine/D-amino acid oxidase-like deaminating enzyme